MTSNYPSWWHQAEEEIHEIVNGFVEKIRLKLRSDPRAIVEHKNPFLFRMGVIEGPDALANGHPQKPFALVAEI